MQFGDNKLIFSGKAANSAVQVENPVPAAVVQDEPEIIISQEKPKPAPKRESTANTIKKE